MTSIPEQAWTNDIHAGTNTSGAVIFFAYIIAALTFTFVIVKDIFILKSALKGEDRKHGSAARPSTHLVRFYSVAALVSFSVLSWNMLNFLLASYADWAKENHPTISVTSTSLRGLHTQAWYVWVWATSSTLFETFAEDLLRDANTWRWTTLSLLYHYACNIYISTTGKLVLFVRSADFCCIDVVLRRSPTPNTPSVGLFRP